MNATTTPSDVVLGSNTLSAGTGPSFAAALCGFLSTTVATTMVMFLLSSV
ncbi:hypothetical protein PMNALOAF_1780 [Methylobacterium adhaesivum]|jgi:hypothetical protein|uniref:Uncharacterized protein n=1 Tax=Methylobacterium adhaesivum TaxID=333297 RepID=A0ABT8BC53_9HYPH|nr:hypothetical protein [Methylobacterium adhaesivum]MDN3589516.1 hypothetical protein [Methylobacterium adhaesivum]GJD30533.1 hypothetical protein PMNALOAF_1780 [Methylobacterium adhaesivum]